MQASVTLESAIYRGEESAATKLRRLNRLLGRVWERNRFYLSKWETFGAPRQPLTSLEQLNEFPFTTRDELLADQISSPPLGTNLTSAFSKYQIVHASSGTTQARLFWVDTSASWRWVASCSRTLFSMAGVHASDRILLALNFSSSSGPWIMHEGARGSGGCCLRADSAEPEMQLEYLQQFAPTVLVIAPAALVALGNVAKMRDIEPYHLHVKKIISFGKDDLDFEDFRAQVKQVWRAEAFNRYGMTEAGSIAGECPCQIGMHLLDSEFIAEIISPETLRPVRDGKLGELVLTNLGRTARPIIRYRTGDRMRLVQNYACACGRTGTIIQGGIFRKCPEKRNLV